eukprot:SAG31_NODE_15670_length_743_cov_1.440994_1_plen_29_part_10
MLLEQSRPLCGLVDSRRQRKLLLNRNWIG